jgi:isocitrate dehydrogenase
MYWAEALAKQNEDADLRSKFGKIAELFGSNEQRINDELIEVQGNNTDIDGYYFPDEIKTSNAMRPSETLSEILRKL